MGRARGGPRPGLLRMGRTPNSPPRRFAMSLPLPLLMILAALLGAAVGAVVDGVAVRWRPPTKVEAAMGEAAPAASPDWWGWLPVVGWLLPLLGGERSKLLAMRATTEIIGAL